MTNMRYVVTWYDLFCAINIHFVSFYLSNSNVQGKRKYNKGKCYGHRRAWVLGGICRFIARFYIFSSTMWILCLDNNKYFFNLIYFHLIGRTTKCSWLNVLVVSAQGRFWRKSLRSTWRRVQQSIRIVGQRIITWRILVIIFVVNFKGYGVELTVEGGGGGYFVWELFLNFFFSFQFIIF